jgi:hypothetical protein
MDGRDAKDRNYNTENKKTAIPKGKTQNNNTENGKISKTKTLKHTLSAWPYALGSEKD